jgi:hypothetical protein
MVIASSSTVIRRGRAGSVSSLGVVAGSRVSAAVTVDSLPQLHLEYSGSLLLLLASRWAEREDLAVPVRDELRPSRSQTISGGAALVSYAVGYPLAIFGHSPIGWIVVMLGGVFLLCLGAITVRRVHRGTSAT